MSKLDKLFSRDVAITKVSKSSDSEDSPDIYIEGYANFGAKDRASATRWRSPPESSVTERLP